MADAYPTYGRIDGPIVIIGFGSIGKGTLPLIERHFDYDASKLTVIDPDPSKAVFLRQHQINHMQTRLTPENYREVLGDLFEGLVTLDPSGKYIPGAASDWSLSDDGKVYTFKLRDDANWSDGEPVVAEDFVLAFQRLDIPGPQRKPIAVRLQLAHDGRADPAVRAGNQDDGAIFCGGCHKTVPSLSWASHPLTLTLAHSCSFVNEKSRLNQKFAAKPQIVA